jgi:hypothetical protein
LETSTKNLADAKAQLGNNADVEARRTGLNTRIADIKRRNRETQLQTDADISAETTRWQNQISFYRNEIRRAEEPQPHERRRAEPSPQSHAGRL